MKMFDYNILNEFLIIFNLFYKISNNDKNQHDYFKTLIEKK